MSLLKDLKHWFEGHKLQIEQEEIAFNAEAVAVAKKEELFNLLSQYFDDTNIEEDLVSSLYKIVGRDTQFSIKDITDDILITELQKHILARDF
jgi:hypothetical protein